MPSRPAYAELHCHTAYSFKEGASRIHELLLKARELGLYALAITDHDNLCGAMEFAQAANTAGIKPVIGVEMTLTSGHHLTLLAQDLEGYRNICRLVTRAHIDADDRGSPMLDPDLLPGHSEGVICLSGCRNSEMSQILFEGRREEARQVAERYQEWFGDRYYIELNQNFHRGDTTLNRLKARMGRELGIPVVATGNVHYHVRDRFRLNDALVSIRHNRSLEETHRERRPNDQYHMRPPAQMEALFAGFPDAVQNTVRIADSCVLDLAGDAIYEFPDADSLPPGHTALSYLRHLCEEAAVRRYGSVTGEVVERLDREFRLIQKHNLAGFLLMYHEIILMAREIQIELGQVEPGLPVEVQPPGRGRGSSVALLAGYLTGLSHIDPLKFGLRLDRFLPESDSDDKMPPPDIDLDFPREIRERLILRVHKRWGYERAVLTGMISTYRVRGAVRDLGRALGLPQDDVDMISGSLDGHAGMEDLAVELAGMPEFRGRLDSQPWQDLLRLSFELKGFPKYLAQHPGGMVLSARPLSETVPLQRSAIDGRYIMQWDKDSAEDAGFVKIDFLALGALSQMTEAMELIRLRTEERIDLSRIDFDDRRVYESIWAADTIGVFQVESAAQMQTVTRLRPSNLTEMAWEVGAVRPGVGVNDGVSLLIHRHRERVAGLLQTWDFDHPLEEPALGRTYGVPLYQDQLSELAVHVAGFSPADGERMRKAFTRRDADRQVGLWQERFIQGAMDNGVPEETARKILGKFHGHYQFPESHAYAFGVTAFQMQWLKVHHPLEFYVGLFNQQPMGFYSLETLKEDAKRHGVVVLNPDVNLSGMLAVVEDDRLRMGLAQVQGVRQATAERILADRDARGRFCSLADFMERTAILRDQLDSLAEAGALDSFDDARHADRRMLRWEVGLRYRQTGQQLQLGMPVEQDMAALEEEPEWDRMIGEYRSLGVHPGGHIMARLRQALPRDVVPSSRLKEMPDGAMVAVAGLVIRRQRPLAKAVFITLEDEHGHAPLILWPKVYERFRRETKAPLLLARGTVSRREGTINVVVSHVEVIPVEAPRFNSKDWG